jgi:predicted DNA-binding transcriptional regulator AlpA
MTTDSSFKPLSKNDVADVLGVSVRTLENWVNEGSLPAPAKLGNRCYWHPKTFYAWLERRLLDGSAPGPLDDGEVSPALPSTAGAVPSTVAAAAPALPARSGTARAKRSGRGAERASSVERMRAKDMADLAALSA